MEHRLSKAVVFLVLVLSFSSETSFKNITRLAFDLKIPHLLIVHLPLSFIHTLQHTTHLRNNILYTKQHTIRSAPSYLTNTPHFTSKGLPCYFYRDLVFDEPPAAPGILSASRPALWTHTWTHGGKKYCTPTNKQSARQDGKGAVLEHYAASCREARLVWMSHWAVTLCDHLLG